MCLNTPRRRALQRGFTLIELLVTLAICAIGLLGIGKLQATALAESQVSRTRALMNFQAEGLAGAMRANRGFWGDTTAAKMPGFTVAAGGTVTDTASTMSSLSPATSCVGATANCSAADIAADDVSTWAKAFAARFPTAIAAVVCNSAKGPISCDITLSWNEHYVAMNRTTAAASAAAAAGATSSMGNTLVLHVQP